MILRHLLSILILPFTVTVVVPVLILRRVESDVPVVARVAGAVVIAIGLMLLATTVRQFARRGRGTLAPWDPPQRLVVDGVYRHVRNPMISGVVMMLAGESLLFWSPRVAVWAALVFLINAVYIPLSEEAGLLRRFGAEYDVYRENVPRWVPRLTAWHPNTRSNSTAESEHRA